MFVKTTAREPKPPFQKQVEAALENAAMALENTRGPKSTHITALAAAREIAIVMLAAKLLDSKGGIE